MSATMRAMPRPAASAHRVAHSSKFRVLARVGMAGHGGIYVLVGVLALALAFGDRSKETDQSGALHTLAQTTGGEVLLLVIAVGLAAYALWQLIHGVFGDDEAKQRWANVARGFGYGALSGTARHAARALAARRGCPRAGVVRNLRVLRSALARALKV